MRLLLLFILLITVLLIAVMEVGAAGIGVAPAELNFNLEKGKKQQKELTVYNLEDREAHFEVHSDADFLEFRHNGVMEGSGMEKIIVEANTQRLDEGNYNSTIYITASNGASGVRLNLGTAVKANVRVFTFNKINNIIGILTSAAIVAAGLLLYFIANNMNKIVATAKKA